jgi:hypothetical protein
MRMALTDAHLPLQDMQCYLDSYRARCTPTRPQPDHCNSTPEVLCRTALVGQAATATSPHLHANA